MFCKWKLILKFSLNVLDPLEFNDRIIFSCQLTVVASYFIGRAI